MRGHSGRWGADRWLAHVVLPIALALSVTTVVLGLAASATLSFNDNIYAPLQFASGFPVTIVGAYIAFRLPRHPIGWVLVVAGWSFWASASTSAIAGWLHHPTWYARPILIIGLGTWLVARGALQILVPELYPFGLPRSWWRRTLLAVELVVIVGTGLCNSLAAGTFDFATGEPADWSPPFRRLVDPGQRVMFGMALLADVGLVVRVARMRSSEARRHRAVAAVAVVLAVPGILSLASAVDIGPGVDSATVEFLGYALLPVVLAYGVLRHRALGFDTVVRRTALYAGMTAVGAAIYVAVVTAFSAVLSHGAGAGPIVATGLVAVSLLPARTLVQRVLDRWVFGDRAEPYRALAGLGRRLEGSTPADDPLTVVADSMRSALRLPWVGIDVVLGPEVEPVRLAGSGEEAGRAESFEMRSGGNVVGFVRAGLPAGEDTFAPADRRLLTDLATAAAVVAHAAVLAVELAQSRDRLVRAREEERRRLRHDLHDGLGPTLASVALGLDAAAARLEGSPELAALLRDLDDELRRAITDIRRLVQGLRPPALDDLGLGAALRQHAEELTARAPDHRLRIDVECDPDLPPLGAAVEVAAFRIALEGMTNVVRHADASQCTVRLRAGHALEVSVEDDGCGIDGARSAGGGVGLESMRDRAEELGGRLLVASGDRGGTLVRAELPLADRRTA